MSTTEVEEAIRRTSMFRRLTQDDRSCLAGVSRLKSCTKGDQIFGEGEPSIVNAFLIVAVFPFTRLVHIR